VTTHPAILKEVLRQALAAGAKPDVGDSPAIFSLKTVAMKSGIAMACKDMDVPMVELNEGKEILVSSKHVKSLILTKRIEDYRLIINMPKLKTHSLCTMTGAVKNLFGLVPGKRKGMYHFKYRDAASFTQMLLEIYLHVKPGLNIMDAVICMEGNGPSAGNPRRLGLIIASDDALALDLFAAELTGLAAYTPLVKLAKARGLVPKFKVSGTAKKVKLRRPAGFASSLYSMLIPAFIKKAFASKPVVMEKICVKCGHCKNACPAGAIKMSPYPLFDYNKCIRCLCCHEVCPQNAIGLKGFFRTSK
jgi:uncharacterized protein (DUF362 family)/Pyruvate/2-oxoacid:ferredoxin oxidoreductase delta subunit